MFSGLLPETPIGHIITIRSETDQKRIKDFNEDQRRIYREWQSKMSKEKEKDIETMKKDMESLSKLLQEMFGEKR